MCSKIERIEQLLSKLTILCYVIADSEENESDCSLMTPKTVTWASEHEERIIENRDMVLKGKPRTGLFNLEPVVRRCSPK